MGQIVIITGNLGRDPEMKYLSSGTAVTNFSIATSEKWKDNDGNQNEVTCWWHVAAYGKLGENCNSYLKKGSKAQVIGKIQPDKKTGNPRIYQKSNGGDWASSLDLRADSVEFLSPVGERRDAPAASEEDEIPF